MRRESLARKFSILFFLFALVTIVTNGVISFINQTQSYHENCVSRLHQITAHLDSLMQKENGEFANIVEWLEEHDYNIDVPENFRDDIDVSLDAYNSYVIQNYDNRFPKYEEMDEEAKHLYIKYAYEYWLAVFLDAAKEYELDYVYYIRPVEGEDHTVHYLIDPSLSTVENENGEKILYIGDKVYEDPTKHPYMWKTWESGESLDVVDSINNEYGYMYTFCRPMYIGGQKLGMVCADTSVDRINGEIARSVLRQVIASTIVFAVVTIILYQFMSRKILKRIERLEQNIEKYSDSKDASLAEIIKENSGDNDEIGHLSVSFADMITALDDYMLNLQKVTREKERIGAELNVATQIQADMLPRIFPPFPDRRDINIYATMTPAKEVGGDFYDFFLIDDDHLALVIADVSGKGVPAALFMVIAKTLIKNRVLMGETPGEALGNVNNQLCEGNDAELFVTVWLAIIDLQTGHICEANAGHEYPAIRRENGEYEFFKTKHAPAVATMEGLRFKENEFDLKPGESIFVYTDGVTEATDSNNELYGEERLLTALNKYKDANPSELLPVIRKDIDEFVGEAPQFDDITMLGFTYRTPFKSNTSED
ncbi:PP2C family protein-serine/threonine phosphatase [Butyrivibrio sp. JL13D10]|uniref:PP2C family protein-serine/threonine phosphatase n=1 Tax=Butyrivibrio sp. JL13D10 TaxID=3236815 RepID=UPI0038B6A0B1